MLNIDNVIYCKECESQIWAGESEDQIATGEPLSYFHCGHCGRVVETLTGREYLALESGRRDRQAQFKAEAKRKRRATYQRERYQAMRSLGLNKTPYGWE